jgi:nitroreductase
MELVYAIKVRRSIRKNKQDPIEKELVIDILEAVNWVPNAKNGRNIYR